MDSVELQLNDAGDRIVVRAGYVDKERIKGVPGARWNARDSVWQVPLSIPSATILQAEFGARISADESVVLKLGAMHQKRAEALTLARNPMALDYVPTAPGDERLRSYQRLGVDWLLTAETGLLGDEMGAGKTAQVVTALEAAPEKGPFLIVCPKSVLWTWQREIAMWSESLVPVVATGSVTKRRKAFKALAEGEANTLLIGYEALKSHTRLAPYGSIRLKKCDACGGLPGEVTETRCETHLKEANEIPWVAVVLDEAHRTKDPKALQTRAVWWVAHQPTVRYRWALTGTPVANAATDIWSILHLIDPVAWPSKTTFLDRWMNQVPDPWGGMQILGIKPERFEEFHALVDPYMLRRTKAMVLPDLPPKLRLTRTCELTPKERKSYVEMRDELITTLEDGTDLMAFNPMVQVGRLLQLANSTMVADPISGAPTPAEPSTKLNLLEEALAEIPEDQSVVVWFAHRKLLHLAEARLEKSGVDFVSFHGELADHDRALAEQSFQAGNVRVMLLTIGTGKEGITLTKAATQIYVQRTWSLIDDLQSQDRLHRPGQLADKVTIIDLIAEDTVEERLHEVLDGKAEGLEAVVQDREALLRVLR